MSTHFWLPCTRASCAVFQCGSADMRLARGGARANENRLGWPSACRAVLCASERGIASKRAGRDAWPCKHHARAAKRGKMPRPPSEAACTRAEARNDCSTACAAREATCTPINACSQASPQRDQAVSHVGGCLAGDGDAAARLSPNPKSQASPVTASAGICGESHCRDPQRSENDLTGSFSLKFGVRPSY